MRRSLRAGPLVLLLYPSVSLLFLARRSVALLNVLTGSDTDNNWGQGAANYCSTRFDLSLSDRLDEGDVDDGDRYENELLDLESEELYGATSMLYELDQLANMLRRGRLHLAPKYQRGYVWDISRASRLVVTALCNRFVPGIVFHEKKKGSFEVVDGKQRMTSLLAFYLYGEDHALFEEIRMDQPSGKLFHKLEKLDENYVSLNGLTFDMLSEERRNALSAYKMTCTIIPFGTPKEDVFSCYEDINSGGMDLKAQQLRRAVFYGPYIEMLDRLAHNEDFQCIRDPRAFRKGTYKPCNKDSDRELILRAFSWHRSYREYKRPLKSFLNKELQHFEKLGEIDERKHNGAIADLENEFRFVIKVWRGVFGDSDGAFRVWEGNGGKGSWGRSINPALWDATYSVLSDLRRHYPAEVDYIRRQEELRGAVKYLFKSGMLDVSGIVTVPKYMERRHIIYNALRKALSPPATSDSMTTTTPPGLRPRTFPNITKLRSVLFQNQDGHCSICGGTIEEARLQDGKYVHIDHMVPYSKGGNSNLSNARLTHAACNRWKSDKEVGIPIPGPNLVSPSSSNSPQSPHLNGQNHGEENNTQQALNPGRDSKTVSQKSTTNRKNNKSQFYANDSK
mmetsp:Transcript_60103/g.178202  ORF Transcript_60103/g.178202 Transcript_60103/m.178202 type:complete len:621 (-) Transcript_60103:80-1942(-)|eukprot:CAMPEP_0113566904 /NCGR_PEP_ID=MMETSP0015_2-20120614/22981_1 /TAXON_ID=2838 /ORGANISM="Odontella" /LENGTH=620 /DNA_ID=CAMNT_0000469243 /DNA_START=64 /DNA_END=1926 /DNA_ORIENTATION=- /assembly_acc=CAM_ASM_000160